MERIENAHKVFVGKLHGKNRASRRWEDNIKADLEGVVFGMWTRFVCLRRG